MRTRAASASPGRNPQSTTPRADRGFARKEGVMTIVNFPKNKSPESCTVQLSADLKTRRR